MPTPDAWLTLSASILEAERSGSRSPVLPCPHTVVAGRLLGGFEVRLGSEAPWTGMRYPDVEAWCVECKERPPEARVERWLRENLHRFPSARAARRLFGHAHNPRTILTTGEGSSDATGAGQGVSDRQGQVRGPALGTDSGSEPGPPPGEDAAVPM